jgi:hypothetical protein
MTYGFGVPHPDSRLIETDFGTPPTDPTPVSQQGLNPAERPATARELCDLLEQCVEEPWTREDARLWWETRLEPEAAVSLVD